MTRGLVVAFVTATVLTISSRQAGAQSSADEVRGSANKIIAANKSDYVAAVVEGRHQSWCKTHGSRTLCKQTVRVLELLCGNQKGRPWPPTTRKVTLFTGIEPAARMEKRLIVAIQSADAAEGYVMMMTGPPTEERIKATRDACVQADGK